MSLRRVGEAIGKFVGDTGRRLIGDGADVQAEARFRQEAAEYARRQHLSPEEAEKAVLAAYLGQLHFEADAGYATPERCRIVHAGFKDQLTPEDLATCRAQGEASLVGAPSPLNAVTPRESARVQAALHKRYKGNKFFQPTDVDLTIASNAVVCSRTIADATNALHRELRASPNTVEDTVMPDRNLQEHLGRFMLAHEELSMHERRIERHIALRQATAKFEQGAQDTLTDMYARHPIEFFKAATRKRGDAADMVGGIASAMAVFFVKEVISSARLVTQVLPLMYYYLKSRKQ